MNSQLRHKKITALNPYDIDRHLRATIMGINQMLDNTAFEHIGQLGFSTESMLQKQMAWLLYQKTFWIKKDMLLNKSYTVNTCITGKERLFTFRDFIITDQDGNTYVEVSSSWVLFDLKSRKIMTQYPEDIETIILPGNDIKSLPRPKTIKAHTDTLEAKRVKHRVGYFDIDANEHMSNHALLTRAIETLDYDIIANRRISQLDIQYKLECFENDELEFILLRNASENNSDLYIHIEKDSKLIAQVRIDFEA